MHHVSRLVLGIPRYGAMRDGAWPLTTVQRAMVLVAKVLPPPVMQRLAKVAAQRAAAKETSTQGSNANA